MNTQKYIEENTAVLKGKCVVLSGATGGLGRKLSRYLAPSGVKLILLNKDPKKAAGLRNSLLMKYPQADIKSFSADFSDIDAVKKLCAELSELPVDYLIHNAGAYAMPRGKNELGVDNEFQINFLSPYYISRKLLPLLEERKAKIILTGSIAHRAASADSADIDYSRHRSDVQLYGNSKRFLMYSHIMLVVKHPGIELSIAHPGICPTGITSHYPAALRAFIKLPMTLGFMGPGRACLPLLNAIHRETLHYSWIGPNFFGIWGKPGLNVLKGCSEKEQKLIFDTAEKLYREMDS